MAEAAQYFRYNPRELKRFVNAFRFEFFLWSARRAQELDAPTLQQLVRWTVLSMRWPELVRWLRRGDGSEWASGAATGKGDATPSTLAVHSRMQLIEEIGASATTFADWQQAAHTRLRLDPAKTPWLGDDDLWAFMRDATGERSLTAGIGKGLW